MTTATPRAPALLAELEHRGIELRPVGDRIRYRPRSAMTPELAERVTAHRSELLSILAAADESECCGADDAVAYSDEERRLLGPTPAVDAAKRAFSHLGGVTVVTIAPFKSQSRDRAARLIRAARSGRDADRPTALRDAWRERLAICTVDGGLSNRQAEVVALQELKEIIAH